MPRCFRRADGVGVHLRPHRDFSPRSTPTCSVDTECPRPADAATQPSTPAAPERSQPCGAGSLVRRIGKILQILGGLVLGCIKTDQNEILQQNMRSTAFFKIYKICILLHRCNLKIFAKNRFEKSAIFAKFQQKDCKCRKICKILSNFKNFSLRIW